MRLEIPLSASEIWRGHDVSAPEVEPSQGFHPQRSWPEPVAAEAYHGLAGRIVRAIEPSTEADPAAILFQLLVAFGNVIGRGPYFAVEDDRHFTNENVVIVGQTSKARKGTSWGRVRRRFDLVDSAWYKNRVTSGLSSGEGVIEFVRDQIQNSEGQIEDPGEADKRALFIEPEFARILAVCGRESNTLSAIIRLAWDGSILRTLTRKKSGLVATGGHISLIAHITKDELLKRLTDTEAGNGFANRFLWVCSRRARILPEGNPLDEEVIGPLDAELADTFRFARSVSEIRRDTAAGKVWAGVYQQLSEGRPGLLGAVTSRGEAHVMRLAMLYGLLDRSEVIQTHHLLAALAAWEYSERSARFIFGDALGDSTADEILRALRASGTGLTRDQIREHFGRHRSSPEISRALGVLAEYGLAYPKEEETGGRPAERWFDNARARAESAESAESATEGGT
jgi:hypothetical protein